MSASWIVYTREGCGLCETFIGELAELLGPAAAEAQVVDIDLDPDLKRRYGDKVPVLVVDGDFVCAIRVDAARIRRILTDA